MLKKQVWSLGLLSLLVLTTLAAAKPGNNLKAQGNGQGNNINQGQEEQVDSFPAVQTFRPGTPAGQTDRPGTPAKPVNAAQEKKAALEAAKAERQSDKKTEKKEALGSTKGSRQSPRTADADQCLAAIDQCRLTELLGSELKPAWERTTLKSELKSANQQRKEDLKRLKNVIIQLIDYTIAHPALDLSVHVAGLCEANGYQKEGGTDSVSKIPATPLSPRVPATKPPGVVGPTIVPGNTAEPWKVNASPSGTTRDPWVAMVTSAPDPWNQATSSQEEPKQGASSVRPEPRTADPWVGTPSTAAPGPSRCVVSEWSQWSLPFGFGRQERTRVVVQTGTVCPEREAVREVRNVTSALDDQGEHVTENVEVVSENFHQDFVKPSEGLPRDLLVILDSSGSISDDEFEAMKEGLVYLIDSLCGGFGPGANQHHLAIVQFSTHARTVHSFQDDQGPEALKAAVASAGPMYGVTCTGQALELAFEEFDSSRGARNYTAHDTLIITDGQSNCREDVQLLAHSLQNRTQVYALAVGLAGNPAAATEVTSLVTDQQARHLFSLSSFFRFRDMVSIVKTRQAQSSCTPIVGGTSKP